MLLLFEKPGPRQVSVAIGILLFSLPVFAAEHAESEVRDGCSRLFELSAPVCIARVRCPTRTDHLETIERIFRQCSRGKAVDMERIGEILSGFSSETVFRCCVGNAFIGRYPLDRDNRF